MNSFGRIFRVNIFGESHGELVGILIDGVPPGISISETDFENDLSRRKPGKKGTTPRKEADEVQLRSGVFNGFTTGAPILIYTANLDTRSRDYSRIKEIPRPGHADFTAYKKYNGYNDYRGGGHFSGRLTFGLVAAGVLAKKIIQPIEIQAKLIEAGGSKDIENVINKALDENDSIGGIVECRANNVEVGLGEPFFDSVESYISHLVFSIPAIKGIEFGSGFGSARMKGSEHNDELIDSYGATASNNAGGINGGITNGNEIIYRVAVKPTSSISKKQYSIDITSGEKEIIEIMGRHDACIALRVPVVLEAVTAIAFADLKLVYDNNK